ncbi:MAG: hypothetical protein ABJK28_04560 [Algibacter sp.]
MNTTSLSITAPPGQPIDQENVSIEALNVTFSFAFDSGSLKPLQPLVQAMYNEAGALLVSAVVFIDASEEPNISGVNWESVISDAGEAQLDFFITYNADELSSKTFKGYRVDFIIENPPEGLEQIQTYLWDEDPVSSRGTKTKV